MGNFRRIVFRHSGIAAAALVAGALSGSEALAQGRWGAEGRIGGGTSAYAVRWFNNDWSLLLGGSLNANTSDRDTDDFENSSITGNAQVMLRREWGASRVRPYFGFGPTVNVMRSQIENTQTDAVMSKTHSRGMGGRLEMGGVAYINESVGLGFGFSASANHDKFTTKSPSGTPESTQTVKGISLGNPQFIIRVRF